MSATAYEAVMSNGIFTLVVFGVSLVLFMFCASYFASHLPGLNGVPLPLRLGVKRVTFVLAFGALSVVALSALYVWVALDSASHNHPHQPSAVARTL